MTESSLASCAEANDLCQLLAPARERWRVLRRAWGIHAAVVDVRALRGLGEPELQAIAREHLCEREWEVWSRLEIPKRRVEWLGGRVAAKWAVIGWTGASARRTAREIEIQVEPSGERAGRPFCAGGPELSIAHSFDRAAAIAASHPVGMDLERLRPVSSTLEEYCGTANERASGVPLLVRWAAKEALLKLAGTGLRAPMSEIQIRGWRPDGSVLWACANGQSSLEAIRDARVHAALSAGYVVALARPGTR